MHYTVDYGLLEGVAKQQKAIQDIKDYLGTRKYNEISREVRPHAEAGRMGRLQFTAQVEMFAGISGYPAEAWADELKLPPYTEKELEAIKQCPIDKGD